MKDKVLYPQAVIGTNSWGSGAYEKAMRGNAVGMELQYLIPQEIMEMENALKSWVSLQRMKSVFHQNTHHFGNIEKGRYLMLLRKIFEIFNVTILIFIGFICQMILKKIWKKSLLFVKWEK